MQYTKDQYLDEFFQELLKWNKKINLISKGSEKDARIIHLNDGMLGVEEILRDLKIGEANTIYDLGAGNGIPGIIFAILDPNRKIISVESDQRKCAFLRATSLKLKLANYSVLNQRVESLPIKGKYFFIARGFAPINAALLLVKEQSLENSVFYHFKSTEWRGELGEECSTWNISELSTYSLSLSPPQSRQIIKTQKKN